MLLIKSLIYLFILHMIFGSTQINLDLTDWINPNIIYNGLQHDCLYVPASTLSGNVHEISSYCISESSSKWNISDSLGQIFTFDELNKQNITSEQLYNWSGSMDIIERYQIYLEIISTISNVSLLLMKNELFYNCTPSRFGPLCQYTFDGYETTSLSLIEIINNYYRQPYEPITLPCYIHLQCNTGSISICLDWSDICDGKLDCIDGNDEKNCELLINNQCDDDNQYRCDNGQCIPKIFVNDGFYNFECLDRSDQPESLLLTSLGSPMFENEDSICSWRQQSSKNSHLTSSCIYQRHLLMKQILFTEKSNTISDNCLMALKCYFDITIDDNSLCNDFCQDNLCIELINNTCPDIFYFPNIPIAFNHIYFIYTKNSIINSTINREIPPEYICFNQSLCDGYSPSNTVLLFDGKTCYSPNDIPVDFNLRTTDWYDRYIKPVYSQLNHCNNIRFNNPLLCNNLTQYQCQDSLKCIPIINIGDGLIDCEYGDDEEQTIINKYCQIDQSNIFFKCQTIDKCIHRNRIENGKCDCSLDEYQICDDEDLKSNQKRHKIQFSSICDRSLDLLPISINGQNETDETDCNKWPCNNIHTRCNSYWTCPNGYDEINCNPSPLLNCSSNHHLCVSIITNQLICLPIEKANDGIIDCLGGIDEPNLCPITKDTYGQKTFYCKNGNLTRCLFPMQLCDSYRQCDNDDDEQFCNTFSFLGLEDNANQNDSNAQKFFRTYFHNNYQSKSTYSSIEKSKINLINQFEQICHRGIPLRVYLNNEKNLSTITCLCPSSYYGNRCQYQNERVSLTIKFNIPFYYYSRPFVVIVSLIDDSNKRIIHSYYQFTYLYIKDQNKKFNIYLIYSQRPKYSTKQYAVHIDIYEKLNLNYRGSLLIPLKFPFLPVERIAIQVNIPSADTIIETCQNNLCIHGQCIRYLNDLKQTSFCQCQSGWTGKYCNISYMCTCSPDSLCIGITPNNRSICVCPLNKYGSQCFLKNNLCKYDSCQNDGLCIPSDRYSTPSDSYTCICPKGFTGSRCEIIDMTMIISFKNDINLPSKSIIPFYFIHLMNNMTYNQSYDLNILCENNTSMTIYRSEPFHLAFIKLPPFEYYMISMLQSYQQSIVINKTISSIDHCPSINEIFDSNIVEMPLIKRIKYYHLPCQNVSLNLTCFYDDIHMCLCYNFDNQRLVNCIEFNHQIKIDDLNFYNNRLESICFSNYLSNSTSLSPITTTTTTTSLPSTRTTSRFQGSGMTSIYACEYLPYLFMMLFCLYIQHVQ